MEHDKYYGDLNLHQFRHLLHIIIKTHSKLNITPI